MFAIREELKFYVITSYSIHYTKLYETILFVITDGGDNVSKNSANMVAKEIAEQKKDERSAFTFTSILFGVGDEADFKKAKEDMGIDHRITSYNVCYTKLLR